MSETPPAGWFADPDDATQYRYWDGAAWTDHRAPRGPTTTDQLNKAGEDLAAGLSSAFTALGNWAQKTATSPGQPTFASVAGSCRDEPARQPLSRTVELVMAPSDFVGILQLFAASSTALTPEGATLAEQPCRLVPNPWDPADPTGVAVLVGATQIGRFPPADAATYSPPLTQLTQQQLLATGLVSVWAQGRGEVTAARATVHVPEPSAFS